MSKPVRNEAVSPDAMKAAFKCAETVLRNLPDDYGDVSYEIEEIARAIQSAVAAEREALWTRLMVQLEGWDGNPPDGPVNHGSIALGNAIWQLFPEFQGKVTPTGISARSQP